MTIFETFSHHCAGLPELLEKALRWLLRKLQPLMPQIGGER